MMNTRKLRELVICSLYEYFDSHLNACSERYYKGIQQDSTLGVKLTGNWETLVGDQDTFLHILEYENYSGYDKATQLVRTSEAG
jgi:hypothetical protein